MVTEQALPSPDDPAGYVNPFIGTGGLGFGVGAVYPGAGTPFGMVKASPDTRSDCCAMGYAHCGGYWYEDSYITGFSNVHLHGPGIADYGNILLFPASVMSPDYTDSATRLAAFSHDDEHAEPGLYQVTLGNGIRVELSATDRTAWHRYTFPAQLGATLVLDLEHGVDDDGQTSLGGRVELDPSAGTAWGRMWNYGSFTQRYGGNPVYFAMRMEPAPVDWGTWTHNHPRPGSKSNHGIDLGAWFVFKEEPGHQDSGTTILAESGSSWGSGETGNPELEYTLEQPGGEVTVDVQVGISFSSQEGAWANLEAESLGRSMDSVALAAREAWNRQLSHITVAGGTEEQWSIFYTALFHSLQMPTLLSDVDGTYPGLDGKLHQTRRGRYYSDFSLWDTYRTLHPLLLLAYPDYARDFARSLSHMARQGGYLPRWPCNRGYTGAMVGDPADIVLAETYIKGIRGWNEESTFDAARLTADAPVPDDAPFGGRADIDGYLERGWVALDETSGSASITLEYAWADRALSLWAQAAGRSEEAAMYASRADYYANTFDAETGFFRGRYSDGSFKDSQSFSATAWEEDYVEGNAWQYLWMVPHDPEGLASLMGGDDVLMDRLDEFFQASLEEEDTVAPDTWYWHGNEPDLHAAYMYALLGYPERGAPWVRWIRDTRYNDQPDGLDGNDDGGTLSAWYVLSALGLYPVAGTDVFALGPPLFDRAQVEMAGGGLTILTRGLGSSPQSYWLGASLDGETITGGTVRWGDISEGAEIVHLLGSWEEPLQGER